jgi:hypothetical protein
MRRSYLLKHEMKHFLFKGAGGETWEPLTTTNYWNTISYCWAIPCLKLKPAPIGQTRMETKRGGQKCRITKTVYAGFSKNKADEALLRHKIVKYELIWITFPKGRKRHNPPPLLPIWNMTPLLQQDPRTQLHVVVQCYQYSKYCMGSTSAGISEGCDPEHKGDSVKGKQ